ncbi:MAG: cupin domain-containing protein [Thermoguttaceae bacterium]
MESKQLRFTEGFRVALTNRRAQAAEMVVAPGAALGGAENRHARSDQWLYVVDGTGVAVVNGRRRRLRAQTLLLIEAGEAHEIRNTGQELLRTLNFYVPPEYREQNR